MRSFVLDTSSEMGLFLRAYVAVMTGLVFSSGGLFLYLLATVARIKTTALEPFDHAQERLLARGKQTVSVLSTTIRKTMHEVEKDGRSPTSYRKKSSPAGSVSLSSTFGGSSLINPKTTAPSSRSPSPPSKSGSGLLSLTSKSAVTSNPNRKSATIAPLLDIPEARSQPQPGEGSPSFRLGSAEVGFERDAGGAGLGVGATEDDGSLSPRADRLSGGLPSETMNSAQERETKLLDAFGHLLEMRQGERVLQGGWYKGV